MADDKFDLEDIADVLGVDQEAISDLGADELSAEKKEFLESVFNLYLTDQEAFNEFVKESGLSDLLAELDDIEGPTSKSEEELTAITNELKEELAKKDLDIDLDL
ncbi:hypothetical protein [Halanaerobaculum tunisiense]